MDPRILDIKRRAKEISAARPQTAFSTECAEELRHASNLFFDHPLMLRLQGDAIGFLNDVCGFGVAHGKRVAMDAAAIVLASPATFPRTNAAARPAGRHGRASARCHEP
jgi:hypothetical protein